MNIQNLSRLKIKSIVTRYTARCQGASLEFLACVDSGLLPALDYLMLYPHKYLCTNQHRSRSTGFENMLTY